MTSTNTELRGFRRSVATTALCNAGAAVAAGSAGIIIARALGPAMRGEYAAVMAWFGVLLVVGQLGQTAATTYFVAGSPERAPDYLSTARNMMVISGTITLLVGIWATPHLAPDDNVVVWGYRLMFATCLASFVGAGYVFGLHASYLPGWNLVRAVQPVAYIAAVVLLYLAGALDLLTAIVAFAVTVTAQSALAYLLCRRRHLTGGKAQLVLARPLSRYGMSQLASTVPGVLTSRLDQLVLAFAAAPSVLGRYAVAASLTTMAVPVVASLGNVAFPRLASQMLSHSSKAQLRRWSLLGSAAVAVSLMVALVTFAPRIVPLVFGPGFSDVAGLVMLLAPGGVFIACGQVCADLLRGHGLPLAVARAQWSGAVVMVVLLVLLVPPLEAAGAAIASTIAAGVALFIMLRASAWAIRVDGTGAAQTSRPMAGRGQ